MPAPLPPMAPHLPLHGWHPCPTSAHPCQVPCMLAVPCVLVETPHLAATPPSPPQELTFEVGPCNEEALHLHAALYAMTPAEACADEFVASGSMSLAHLREVHSQRHVRVPLVSAAGAHLADLSIDLRFFHSRNPARQRDAAGREFIDEGLAEAGPVQAARLLNQRSPHSPTAAPRPGSPRVKPPLHDPPGPELPAAVRTTLGEEE
ncbi:hypothetical protein ABPG75_004997 [Micractinium tetrahymenae]